MAAAGSTLPFSPGFLATLLLVPYLFEFREFELGPSRCRFHGGRCPLPLPWLASGETAEGAKLKSYLAMLIRKYLTSYEVDMKSAIEAN